MHNKFVVKIKREEKRELYQNKACFVVCGNEEVNCQEKYSFLWLIP